MFRRVQDWRRVGWSVLVFAAVVLSIAIAVRAFGADSDAFNRWVGWANILAAVCGALGLWLVLRPPRASAARTPEEIADALTRQVLDREGRVLSNLLNIGHEPGRPANLVFYVADGVRSDLTRVAKFYQAQPDGRLVVLGAPGAGKTVLLLRLICDLAEARSTLDHQERSRTPVPLRFDLVGWNTTLGLVDWLADAIAARYTNLTRKQAMTLLEQRLVLPVLDGLDEMDALAEDPRGARAAVDQLNRYLSGTALKPVVLACREEEYRQLGTLVADTRTVRIVPLAREEVDRYVRRELARDSDPGPLEGWDRSTPATLSTAFWEAVSTPWALTLLVVYLRDGGRMDALVNQPEEDSTARDGERILSLLMGRYLPARVRAARHGSYSVERVQRWTAELARNLGEGVDIRLEDIWRIGGASGVRAWHTLLALLIMIGGLAMLALAVNGWDPDYLFRRVRYSFEDLSAIPRGWLLGGAGFVLTAGLAMTAGVLAAATTHPAAVFQSMTLTKLRTVRGRKDLVVGLVSGLVSGLVYGFLVAVGAGGGLVSGLVLGLLIGLVVGINRGLRSHDLSELSPAAGVISDLLIWLAAGLIGGVAGGLVRGLVGGIAGGLAGGLASGLAFGVGAVWMRYAVGSTVSAAQGNLPVRLVRFLEWCNQEGILRRSGPAYQFRHLSLRNHLRESSATKVLASTDQ